MIKKVRTLRDMHDMNVSEWRLDYVMFPNIKQEGENLVQERKVCQDNETGLCYTLLNNKQVRRVEHHYSSNKTYLICCYERRKGITQQLLHFDTTGASANLKIITLDTKTIKRLYQARESYDSLWQALAAYQLSQGWKWEGGKHLTASPVFRYRDSTYWYPQYETTDEILELLDKGTITFERA